VASIKVEKSVKRDDKKLNKVKIKQVIHTRFEGFMALNHIVLGFLSIHRGSEGFRIKCDNYINKRHSHIVRLFFVS